MYAQKKNTTIPPTLPVYTLRLGGLLIKQTKNGGGEEGGSCHEVTHHNFEFHKT